MATRTTHDYDSLAQLLRKQQLVISRVQLLDQGMTPDAIRHRLRLGGPWQRLLPGVYLTATGTPTETQIEIAALLYAGPGSVITGLCALRRHGMRTPATSRAFDRPHQPGIPPVLVLVPGRRVRASQPFVTVLPTWRMPEFICYDGPVQFALPPRAVADAARRMTSFREVRALVAGAVQQRICRIDFLGDELRQGPVRGSAWLRRALAEVADGIQSVAEGDLRDLLVKAKLPMPMFNAHLYAGRDFLAIADAWWQESGVAAEVDSREWHLSPDDWEQTLARHARMSAHGIIVLHFTPGQIRRKGETVAEDIRSALKAGSARPRLAIRVLPPT